MRGLELTMVAGEPWGHLLAGAALDDELRARLAGGAPRPEAIPRLVRHHPLPLSCAQHRIWFLERLAGRSPLYTVPIAVRLRGPLDRHRLRRAIDAVVERHEVLRMAVVESDGLPAARLVPDVRVPVESAPAASATDVSELISALARQPFDLSTGPLVRLHVIECGLDDHVLLVLLHHLVCDAWSLEVFFDDLAQAYAGSELPPLAHQFADVALWQDARANGPALDRSLSYWRGQLAGASRLLTLSCAAPRPAVPSYQGAVVAVPLPDSLVDAAAQRGCREGVTLSMVFLAAWLKVLHRHSGEDDLVVGTAMPGRSRVEAERLIGPFTQVMPLRVRVANGGPARELLLGARDAVLGAIDHADVSFDRLVRELNPGRSAASAPVFQVTFDVRQSWPFGHSFGGLAATPVLVDTGTARDDLALSVDHPATGWLVRLTYARDLFSRKTAVGLGNHFVEAVEAMVVLSEGRKGRGSRRSPTPGLEMRGPPTQGIVERISERMLGRADAVAVSDSRRDVTYRELDTRSRALAQNLRALGVSSEIVVGVVLDRTCELVIALLGILRAGGAYLPLDPDYPPERLATMLKDAAASVTVTETRFLDMLPSTGAQRLCIDEEMPAIGDPPLPVVPSGSLAYVIYTSGSTGMPKGVQVTHANLATFLKVMADLIDFQDTDSVLAITTPAFDIAALELLLPLTRGGRVVVGPTHLLADGRGLRAWLAQSRATVLQATPVTWRQLGTEALASLRVALCGGERMNADLARFLASSATTAWNVYGPTETTVWSSAMPLDRGATPGDPVPIGRPIDGTSIHVLDGRLQVVIDGEAGELCIGGPGVARGYRGQPALTAERFVPNPFGNGDRLYRTGDLGRACPDGTFEFLGRLDEQIKIRGLRVEPAEIESALRAQPGVSDAVAVAHVGPDGEAVLTGYVVPVDPAVPPLAADLRTALRSRLPNHLVPTAFVTLSALPRTPNGKVHRGRLPEPDLSRPENQPASVAPRDEVERLVAGVWAELLDQDRIGVEDNLFDLGGHSLIATQIAARLRQLFGVDPPLRLLFDHPTVAGLARQLFAGSVVPDLPPRPHAGGGTGPAPLSFPQEQVWLLSQLPAAGLAYHVHTTIEMSGPLKVSVLRRALDDLTARHEVLRATFSVIDGVAHQRVVEHATADLREVDLTTVVEERERHVERLIAREVRQPFDLAEGPLVRWTLLRLNGLEHRLVLVAHHIVLDGWSVALVLRELAALYHGENLALPQSFCAIARWQRAAASSPSFTRQRRYWRDQLATAPTTPLLPHDRPPPPFPDFCGGAVRISLGPSDDAGKLCRRLKATPFMVLFASFALLLRRHSGQDDICVGTPMAARRLRQLEDVAGMLVNTVVLRCDLTGDPSFSEVVRRARRIILEAHANQEFPFSAVVDELRVHDGHGRNPLYQTLFGLNDAPAIVIDLDGPARCAAPVHNGTAKLDLTVMVTPGESKAGTTMSWEYATDVFDRSTVVALAEEYATLHAAACADPDRPISALAPTVARPAARPERRRSVSSAPGRQPGRTAAELAVTQVFSDLLGVATVDPDDDFFDLGGHSLLALRAVVCLSARLGTALPLRVIMENRTVTGLAAAIDRLGRPRAQPASVRATGPLILVTGGTGMVGGYVTQELRRRGMRVRIFARPSSAARARLLADEVAEGDLAEPASLAEAMGGVHGVVHAACTFTRPEVDVRATEELLRGWSGGTVVLVSSTDVYGTPSAATITEEEPLNPGNSAYAVAKATCERLLTAAGHKGFAILRPPFVWAPHSYCWWQLRQTIAAPLHAAARAGRPVQLPAPGRGHAWVDARDLAWVAAECLARTPDGPLNVITGNFAWRDVATTLIRLMRLEVAVEPGEPRSGLYSTHRRFSATRAAHLLGFQPNHVWSDTLAAAGRAAQEAGRGQGASR